MTEFELKLDIPPAALPAVRAALQPHAPQPLRLRAQYLDTPTQALARAGVALRLRLEGDAWVQTAKGPGTGAVERLEHNAEVAAPVGGGAPAPDLARHDGTPLGARIRTALQAAAAAGEAVALAPVFETDVQRSRAVQQRGATRLELALDVGRILAGGRSEEVCELEIEALEGPLDGVLQAARDWIAAHGLWLSTRSKAGRGRALALGLAPKAPRALPAAGTPGLQDAALTAALELASTLAVGEGGMPHRDALVQALQLLGAAGAAAQLAQAREAQLPQAVRALPVQQALLAALAVQSAGLPPAAA